MFFAPLIGRSRCYALLHCKEYGHMRTWNIHNAGKTLYIGIEAMYLSISMFYLNIISITLENIQQIVQNNVKTCIRYILVVCVMPI